jgi:hypothetical protein
MLSQQVGWLDGNCVHIYSKGQWIKSHKRCVHGQQW